MRSDTMADIWALDHECKNLFGTCRACEQIVGERAMATIEQAYKECDDTLITPRWADRAEMLAAIRVAMSAVLEFVCPFRPKVCARYAKQSVIHSLHQVALERINALAQPQEHAEPPEQEEGA